MIDYLVWIYMPKGKSYDFAGFSTSQIAFNTARLQDKHAENDKDVLAVLNDIRAHDQFAAIVPLEFAPSFMHEFLNYAMAKDHPANVGIAIRASINDTTVTRAITPTNPRPLHEVVTISQHPVATLKLFKCQFLDFVAIEQNIYQVTFNVTGGDKFVLGVEPGMPGDFHATYEQEISYQEEQWEKQKQNH